MPGESSQTRPPRRWLEWLHRIGYVTTALVLVGLIWIGALALANWWRFHQWEVRMIESTRTREAPLSANRDEFVREYLLPRLSDLPSAEALAGNGLRFVAEPSFGTADYALALWLVPGDDEAKGRLVVVDRTWAEHVTTTRRFTMPRSAFARLVARFDSLSDGWRDARIGRCLDGTSIAFERVRGARFTSGWGNCGEHYHAIEVLLLDAVRRFAPGDDLPTEDDWHRFRPEPQQSSVVTLSHAPRHR